MLPPPWPWPLRTTPLTLSLSLSLSSFSTFFLLCSLVPSSFTKAQTTHSNQHVSYTRRKRLTNRGHAARTTSTSSSPVSREPVARGSTVATIRPTLHRYSARLRLATHTRSRFNDVASYTRARERRDACTRALETSRHSDRFSPRSNRSLPTFSTAKSDTARISTVCSG